MANLIVTFGRSMGTDREYGGDARTEILAIGGGATDGTLVARGSEDIVTLYAEADCWVTIGASPDPEAANVGANRRFMKLGWDRTFSIGANQRVSVTSTS